MVSTVQWVLEDIYLERSSEEKLKTKTKTSCAFGFDASEVLSFGILMVVMLLFFGGLAFTAVQDDLYSALWPYYPLPPPSS